MICPTFERDSRVGFIESGWTIHLEHMLGLEKKWDQSHHHIWISLNHHPSASDSLVFHKLTMWKTRTGGYNWWELRRYQANKRGVRLIKWDAHAIPKASLRKRIGMAEDRKRLIVALCFLSNDSCHSRGDVGNYSYNKCSPSLPC